MTIMNEAPLLQKGRTALSSDLRPIEGVYWERGGFTVGDLGVTSIEAYDESGEMSMVPWLAVFKGDEISTRIPARNISVRYHTKADEGF